jgi:cytochrome P450
LVRDPELVKNILVKDFQNFMDRQISTDEKTDPLWANTMFMMKGQRWRELRTSLTPLFSIGKMKMMFGLVDVCGKELAAYLDKATFDGKFCQGENTV